MMTRCEWSGGTLDEQDGPLPWIEAVSLEPGHGVNVVAFLTYRAGQWTAWHAVESRSIGTREDLSDAWLSDLVDRGVKALRLRRFNARQV